MLVHVERDGQVHQRNVAKPCLPAYRHPEDEPAHFCRRGSWPGGGGVGAPDGAWTMLNYEDDPEAPPYHWTEGWGTFWYSSSPGFRSVLAPPNESVNWPHQLLFSRTFVVTEAPGTNSSIVLNHFIDDGAVFYLNGREISRVRMPSGTVDRHAGSLRLGCRMHHHRGNCR